MKKIIFGIFLLLILLEINFSSGITTLTNISTSLGIEDIAVRNSGATYAESFIKFNVSAITTKTNVRVLDATLGVMSYRLGVGSTAYGVNCSNQSWTESVTTGEIANLHASCAGSTITKQAITTLGWKLFKVTNELNASVQGGQKNFTILLNVTTQDYAAVRNTDELELINGSGSTNYVVFNSSEAVGSFCGTGNPCAPYLQVNYSGNTAPTHSNPILNSTNPLTNSTQVNLTCYNQSVADIDTNDNITSIFNWYKDSNPTMLLYLAFDTNNTGASGSIIKDYSSNKNNASWGVTQWDPRGIYGGAVNFSGVNTNFLTVTDTTNGYLMSGMSNFSVSFWVYPQATQKDYGRYFEKPTVASCYDASGVYCDFVGSDKVYYGGIARSGSLTKNGWSLIVVTGNSSGLSSGTMNVRTYVNGSNVRNGTINAPRLNSSNLYNFYIGWYGPTNYAYPYNGSIDDFRVWNMTLTPEQVKALYQNKTWQITRGQLQTSQNWSCEVTINDGTTDSSTLNSTNITILRPNAAPTTPSTLAPASGTRTTGGSVTLTCGGSTDPDGDTVRYSIYIGSSPSPTTFYPSSNTTSTTNTIGGLIDGQLYYWRCKAEDWKGGVSAFTADRTFKENSLPAVTNVAISPAIVYSNSILNCSANFSDAENDKLNVTFSWYNGSVLYSATTIKNIASTNTNSSFLLTPGIQARGERWNCSVNAFDGYENSTSKNATASIAPCTITSALITPNCAGGSSSDCEQGETISMSATYTGDCSDANFFQIDANSSDKKCIIEYAGGNMSGVSSNAAPSGGTVTGTWTIPAVPAECLGKTVNAWVAGLWQGIPGTGIQIDSLSAISFGQFIFYVPTAPSPKTGNYSIFFKKGQFILTWENLSLTQGRFKFGVFDGTEWKYASSNLYDSGSWKHVIGRYNGTHVSIYVEGVKGIDVSVSSMQASSEGLLIGRDDQADHFFRGGIDDTRIFNRSLSDKEVQDVNASRVIFSIMPKQNEARTYKLPDVAKEASAAPIFKVGVTERLCSITSSVLLPKCAF